MESTHGASSIARKYISRGLTELCALFEALEFSLASMARLHQVPKWHDLKCSVEKATKMYAGVVKRCGCSCFVSTAN